ncbi:MAG: class I SAM-dependent methyltransferase, partial [Chloroflexota bacterium]|nr:class I SAM-dependent methyltransferase [Chloroflexota bacterium]
IAGCSIIEFVDPNTYLAIDFEGEQGWHATDAERRAWQDHETVDLEFGMPRRATRVDDFANRDLLDDIEFGLMRATVLKAAIELEIFTRLAEGHRTVPALSRIGGTNERGTRILLDALCFIGLLSKQHTEYRLSPTAEAFLVKGKPSYYGDAMLGDYAWDARGQLSKLLRTGKPILPAAYSDAFEATWAGAAASNLADWQRQIESANAFWDKVGVSADNLKVLRVHDVACGSALLSFALAKRYSIVRLTAIDRPMVLPYVKQLAEAMGVASQVTLQAGDALNLDLKPESSDVILFGNITEYLSPEQNIGMFRKAYEALVPNGRAVITAPIADEDHKGPGQVPISGIDMLLFSPEGDTYTFVEYRGMLETAGFSEVSNYKDDWGIVSARRIDKPPAKNEK